MSHNRSRELARSPSSPGRRWGAAIALLAAMGTVSCAPQLDAATEPEVRLVPVAEGWARNSINAAIFRQNSVVTYGNTQFLAYYDPEARVVLARRELGSQNWETHTTQFTGNVRDAHNAICIAVDGAGVLHVAWDHHGHQLNYARGTAPGSLELGEPEPMTGRFERSVTYPQFYHLPGGDLLFLYRDGSSGQGNIMLNRFDVDSGRWSVVQHPLIDGQGERNAYVNHVAVDADGGWHLSWTWRDTPDVATNHDIHYGFSPDGGRTWRRSTGGTYALPITAATSEVVRHVPRNHELINQTSMAVDAAGQPMIATYWRPEGTEVPQFHLVWFDGESWHTSQVGHRTTPFRLSGGGTRRIPVSRPLVLGDSDGGVYVVFRDEERGGGVSIGIARDPERSRWEIVDLPAPEVGLWEPSHDPVAWSRDGQLHLFHQRVGQGQGETLDDVPPQLISVLEWTPPSR